MGCEQLRCSQSIRNRERFLVHNVAKHSDRNQITQGLSYIKQHYTCDPELIWLALMHGAVNGGDKLMIDELIEQKPVLNDTIEVTRFKQFVESIVRKNIDLADLNTKIFGSS